MIPPDMLLWVHIGLVRAVLRLNVSCPWCGETAGFPCRTPAGRYMSTVHASRDERSLSALRDGLAAALGRNTAARMRVRRASAAWRCTHQEDSMTASPVTGHETTTGNTGTSRHP